VTLEAGRILGHYEIVSTLGAGGMGEVYRARDTRLGREVALKLVLAEVSADPERLARFEREARVLAALNHPNIATLHGFETADADGTRFLVMELVEGETLADRIARGPIPTDEAIALFVAIAEGLEAAHEKGIVHRDLKPANIKVAPDGRVKILDFGLAKALAPESPGEDAALSHSPTLTLAATRRGEVLGTAAYMSPEQASGKAVDKRTDVWAFGGCLYEALTGGRAFPADDLPNTLAAVLRDEPDWGALPAGTPPRVRRLLQRCLAKKPRERLHDIADARLVLEESEATAAGAGSVAPRRAPFLAAALGFALAGVAAAIAWIALRPAPPGPPSLRLDLRIAEATGGAIATSIALAPDGTRIAYVIRRELGAGLGANDTLYVRELDELEGTALAEGAVAQPFFSPDGRWIAFFTGTTLEKVPVAGGTAVELAPADLFMQGDWSEDDRIVFTTGYSHDLQQVSAAGGETTRLTDVPAGNVFQLSPHFLPGGRHLLFTEFDAWQGTRDPTNRSSVRALDLESGAITTVLDRGAHARYLHSGHLVYLDGGVLFAVPFDLEALAATGPPVKSSVTVFTFPVSDYPAYSVSRSGNLLHIPRLEDERNTAVWVDREGRSTPLLERGFYGGPRLSPDGTRLAVTELRDSNVDVHVYDLEHGARTRLTFDPARDDDVVWSVDGKFLLFNSLRNGRNGIYRLEADGAGDAEPLFLWEGPGAGDVYPSSSGPGGLVAFCRRSPETSIDVLVLQPGASEPEVVVGSAASEEIADFSPDGRWIAYSKQEAGGRDVFVRAYPPRPGLTQVSSGGGRDPKWSRDGRELFYWTDSGIVAVSVEARDGILRAGTPKLLFSRAARGSLVAGEPYYPAFDVAPDGQHFVVIQPPAGQWGSDHVRLVTNFFAELERIAPAR
jgi:serine/threonine-protein kinase